jgi:uncharacterized repeat protein (TIGR01451 family)/fimbrial isopeptide formation D2 family protein
VLFVCADSASALTGAGTQITNLATARYTDHTGAPRTSESLPVVLIVAQVADFTLTSDTCRVASPAGTSYIPHTLTNTGNGPDTFSLAVANIAGGDYAFSNLIIFSDVLNGDGIPDDGTPISITTLLSPGEQFQFIVALSAPATATNGQTAEALVSGISQFDGGVTATNTDCVTITANAVIFATKALSGSHDGLSPSGPYTYTLSYMNTSNATATDVTFTDSLPPGMTYFPNSGTWGALGALTDASGLEGAPPNTIDYSVSGNVITVIITEVAPGRSGTIAFQATVDAGLLAPQNLHNTASFEYDDSVTTHAGPFNTNTVTFSVLQVAGVDMTPPPSAPAIFQGQTVAFENVVTNTGNGVDTFDIVVVSDNFPAGTNFRLYTSGGVVPLLTTDDDPTPDTGPLQPSESYTVVLVAILPAGETGGPFSVSKTATSSVDETVFATVTDVLEGIIANTVDVTDVCAISDTDQTATGQGAGPETDPVATNQTDPGTTTTFYLFIENTSPAGAPADSYDVTCSASPTQFSPPVPLPTGWTVVIKNTLDTIVTGTGLIPQGDFEELLVEVTVPPDYPPGAVELYCQVFSPSTGAVDVRHDEVIVNTVRGLAMTPNNTGQVFPGESIVYKHIITNNGNIPETDIALAVSNDQSGWVSAVFEDTNGNGILDGSDLVAGALVSLAVNESKTFLVQVFSPLNAALGVADVSTLTATPTLTVDGEIHYPLVVTDNTAVMAGSLGISKEQALDATCDGVADSGFSAADIKVGSIPGACILYKITATNTGTEKIINLLLNDATPPHTVYYISTPMPPAFSTVGTVSLSPSASQNGEVIADVGTMLPNQSVVLTFGVQIAAGTPAGSASVDNQTSATYNDFTFEDRTATSNTVILVVAQAAGVTLTADTTKTSTAGSVVYFAHTLMNTGNGTDTFSLVNANSAGDDYDFSVLAVYPDANGDGIPDVYTPLTDTGLLNAGGIFRFVIAGTVSGFATPGQIGKMIITATSLFNGGVTTFNTDHVVLSDGAILEVYKAITSISGPSPSGRYTYSLSYFNKSSLPAIQVTLTDVVPVGMTYMAGSARWSVTGLLATDPPLTEAVDAPQGPGGGAPTILYDFNATATISGTITVVISEVGGGQSGLITFEVTVNAGLSPQTLNNVVSYTYDDSGAVPLTSNTVGFTVTQEPGMTIVGETIAGAPQGSTVSFHNLVTNTGSGVDTFDILVGVYDDDGNLIFPPLPEAPFPAGTTFQLYQSDGITPLSDTNANTMLDTGPLLPGASYTVVLQVTLPPTAVGGPFGVVKAVKSALTAMTVSAPDILTLITLNEVDLTNDEALAVNPGALGAGPGPEENPVLTYSVAPPGTTLFTLVVNNTSPAGMLPETYKLEASTNSAFSVLTLPPGVTVLFKNSGGGVITQTASLAPGQSEVVTAEVTVAVTTPFGTNDIYFRALSGTSGASDRKHDAIFVEAVRALTLTPDNVGQVYPDNFIVYTHTLTNNGNIVETDIVLSVANDQAGWVSEIYEDADPDGGGPLLPNGQLDAQDQQVTLIALLPISTSTTLLVKVIAPPEPTVTQGMVDVSTLTATPQAVLQTVAHGPISVTDTSTVIISRIVLTKKQALDADCDGVLDTGVVYAADPITPLPGACIRYQILAESTGNTDAVNVLVNEGTPPNTVYHDLVPATASVGSITTVPNPGEAGDIVATLGTMAPGATAEMTFGVVVTTTAPANSNIDNTANAAHTDSSGLARAATSGTVSAQVLQVAGLLLTDDGALDASPGGNVYFPHTLTNTGNGDDSFALTAVNLAGDDFDFNALVFYADADGNGIPDNTLDTNGDTIPDSPEPITDTGLLAAGGLFRFVVEAAVPLSALSGQVADLTVTAVSAFDPSQTASNTDRATVVRAVVSLNKTIEGQTAIMGLSPSGPYVYTLSYENTGNGPATALTLTDTIPMGMTYVMGSGLWSVTGVTALTDAADGAEGTPPDTIDYSISGKTITAVINQVPASGSGTVQFSVNVDAGLLAAQVLANTASYEYDDSPTSNAAPANSNTVDFTVLQAAGVTLDGDTEVSAPQGGTLTFENVLTNTGNGPDTFEISLSASGLPDGTTLALDGTPLANLTDTVSVGPIPAGGSHTVLLQVILPTGATGGPFSISKTATSVFDPTVSDSATDTLNAITPNSVDLTNDAPLGDPGVTGQGAGPEGTAVTTQTVVAGETASFFLFLNNTSLAGNLPDTYQFEASSDPAFATPIPAGWGLVFTPSLAGPISAGGSLSVGAAVTVPGGFAPGTYDLFFRTVSPAFGDADIKHEAVTVSAAIRELTLVSNDADTVFAGTEVVYSHTLTNNGNVAETGILLTTVDPTSGWGSTIYIDADGDNFPDSSEEVTGPLDLDPNQSVTLLVVVAAPAGAVQDDQDTTTLTATPQTSIVGVSLAPVALNDTSTVVAGLLNLTKEQALDADCNGTPEGVFGTQGLTTGVVPGACVRYQITATSVGSADVQNLSISDVIPAQTTYHAGAAPAATTVGLLSAPNDGGTGAVSVTIAALAPGDSTVLTFGVQVVAGALAGEVVNNSVAAAYSDGSAVPQSASAEVAATVQQVGGFTLTADGATLIAPGQVVFFSHTLTNTGNGTETFTLTDANLLSDIFDLSGLGVFADADQNVQPDGAAVTSVTLDAEGVFHFVIAGTVPSTALNGQTSQIQVTGSSGFDGTVKSNTDTVTVTANAVVVVTKTVGTASGLSPSGPHTYTISYSNSSNATATAVTLSDVVPAGMTYVPGSGLWSVTGAVALTDTTGDLQGTAPDTIDYSISGNTITAVIAQIEPGGLGTVTFQVDVNAGLSPQTITNTVSYGYFDAQATVGPFTDSVDFEVLQSNLTIAKMQALDATCDGVPDTAFGTASIGALPGACIRYQITVANSGSASATSVQVQDGTPSQTTYHSTVAATTTQGSVVPPSGGSGGLIDVTVGTLGVGQSVTITFGVAVQAGTLASVEIANDADVDFVDAAGVSQSLTSSLVTAVVAQTYGLSLVQDNQQQSGNPGQTVYFPHTLTNLGNGTDTFSLTNVNEPDSSDPQHFDFTTGLVLYADPNCNGIPDAGESTTPIISTGSLGAGVAFCFIASAQVPTGAQNDDLGVMTVTAVSQGDVTKTDKNTDDVLVTSDAVLNVTKTVSPDFGISLSGTTYTISYSNFSSATATVLTLTDIIPAGMTYVPGSARWSVTGAVALTDATGDFQGTVPDTIDYSISSGMITAVISQVASGQLGTVTFQVDVNSGVPQGNIQNTVSGNYNNGAGLVQLDAAADFTVIAQPTVTKAFGADSIISGGHTTLTITINNSNVGAITTSGFFTDTLPLGMVIGTSTPAGSCDNVTATLGDNKVTMASGTTVSFGDCTIIVDVTATAAGDYTNTIPAEALNTVTAGSNALPATDTLTVFTPPTVNKAFNPTTILPGGVSTLTITIGNPNATALTTSGPFTDTLPDEVTLGSGNTGSCTGVTATVGASSISLASGTTISAGGCTIVVEVTATTVGDYTNTISVGALSTTTAGGNTVSAEDTLTVSTLLPPTVTKAFGAESMISDGQTTLTITIGNNNTIPLTVSGNTPDTLQSSMVLTAGDSGTCRNVPENTGIIATVGEGSITIPSGMIIPAGGCTIVVDITATLPGTYVNTIRAGELKTATAGSNPSDATDTLTVTPTVFTPPTMTKAFDLSDVAVGATSTLRITINNPNLVPVSDMALTDLYPTGGHPIGGLVTGMINAASPSVNNSCGGTVTATALDNEMSFSGGSLGAAGQCVIEIQVLACPVGNYINTTSVLISNAPDTLTATATLKAGCPAGNTYTGNTGPGDLNCDGIVNIDDITIVTSNFGKTIAGSEWVPAADPNCDQLVNIDDLTIVTTAFGRTY